MFAIQKTIFPGNNEVKKGAYETELEAKQTFPLSSGWLCTVKCLLTFTKR